MRNGCSTLARTLALVRFFLRCNSSTICLYLVRREVMSWARGSLADRLALPLIGSVAPHLTLVSVQQVRQHMLVCHRSHSRAQRVHDAFPGVHAYMRFHPKVPLVALARLVHFRIARAG